MLSRYSHIRNEAKRKALEEICTLQTAAEAAMRKKHEGQAQGQQAGAILANVEPISAIQ
jgi:hypothetical protein